MRRPGTRQRGAALILWATVLILGMAWFAVGALGKAARTTAEKETKTGLALQAAKQALLAHVAQYAARSATLEPGQLPCPESVSTPDGTASGACSNATETAGRLPWKTLGIDQLRDGDGEPLWYVLSRGFRSPPINFGSSGAINYNGAANAAVALIIAPGAALNNTSDPGTPPAGCGKVNQQSGNRNSGTLDPTKFFECGNATGSYANPGNMIPSWSQWSNDRVIAITAAEWADAIAGPLADRLQRQVAALLGDWHQVEFAATGRSWGNTYGLNYLPFASTWGDPTTTDYCGNQDVAEGLAPVDATCYDNKWSGNSNAFGGMNTYGSCTDQGTYLRCRFERDSGSTPLSATISVTTSNVGRAFRSTIAASDLTITGGGTATIAMTLPNATSDATANISLSWPITLPVGSIVEVQIPHLQAAAVLSDSRFSWFWNNNWQRYTYYAIAASAAPPGTAACTPGVNCVTVNGLPASTGASNDKRLVLVLSGRPLAGQTQPSGSRSNYYESTNATSGDDTYVSATATSIFNDRVAACPFKHTDAAASSIVICN